jgi:sec-independent protein translocase protein TatB
MFGIGAQELILLMVAALIIFGPQRLPEIAQQVGKAIRDFRRMSDDLTGEFQRSFSLEDPPAAGTLLPAGTVEADTTPNGVGTAIAEALRVETIPSDPEPVVEAATESEPTTTAASETISAPQDIVINLAPVATKADPLVGVSSLDEPAPYTGERTSETPGSSTAPTESYETLSTTAIAEGAPLALETAPAPGLDGSSNHVQNGIADAWDAVITTEATVAVAVAEPEAVLTAPEGYAYPPNTASPAESISAEPARPKIDPAAEVTIREKIEAQVASEAFRERRRIASYQRARK